MRAHCTVNSSPCLLLLLQDSCDIQCDWSGGKSRRARLCAAASSSPLLPRLLGLFRLSAAAVSNRVVMHRV